MISEISFSKLTRDETKKLTWLTALWFLLFFFLIPFRSLLALTIRNAESAWYEAEAPLNTLAGQMGFGHIENTVFILGAGIFCALTAFSYVQSQVRLAAGRLLERRRQELALGLELGLVPAQLAVELALVRRVGRQLAAEQAEGLALPERPHGQPLVRAVGPPAVMGLLEPPGTCPEQPQCTEWCFAQAELGTEPELALA